MSCIIAEMWARSFGWKSSDDLQREAEREAKRNQREAEQKARDREEEALKAAKEKSAAAWKKIEQQYEEANADLSKALYDSDFKADPDKVAARKQQVEADIAQMEKAQHAAFGTDAWWSIQNAKGEAERQVRLLESIATLKADDAPSALPAPHLPSGNPRPGNTVREYSEVLENQKKQVGVLEKYVTGPTVNAIEGIGEDIRPMLNPPVGYGSETSDGGGAYQPPPAGQWTPRTTPSSTRGQTAPPPPAYKNPLADLNGPLQPPGTATPRSGNDLDELLELVDRIGEDKTTEPVQQRKPPARTIPTDSPPSATGAASGKPPANPSLLELIKAFEKK
jgi:hypothetical protein